MQVSGILLIAFGLVVSLIGGLDLIFAAFKKNIFWGFGCVSFIPLSFVWEFLNLNDLWWLGCVFSAFVMYVFAFFNWKESKRAFFMFFGGFVLMILGKFMCETGGYLSESMATIMW